MRPRLRDHVLFTERPDGTYVHAPHGGTLLRGPGLHPWLTRLAPFLTGEHTLAELVGELPPDRRDMVENLVEELARGGYVRDHTPGRPPPRPRPTADEPHAPAEQLAFLGYTADHPEDRLQRLREARIVVSGSAPALPLLTEVMRLGLHSGWRSVRTVVREGAGPPGAAVAVPTDTSGAATARPVSAWAASAGAVTAESDLLIWVTGRGEAPPEGGRGAWCPVRLSEAAAWVGPVMAAEDRTAGDVGEGDGALDAGAVSVVAAQVVLMCTRQLAGLEGGPGDEASGRGPSGTTAVPSGTTAVRVDLPELTTSEHPVTHSTPQHPVIHRAAPRHPVTFRATARHPVALCPTAEAVTAWWASPALPMSELWSRVAPLVDPYTGILREVSAGSWHQHPWWTCRAVLEDGTLIGAHGPTRESARSLAALRALATANSPEGPVWGWDLTDGRPRLLTAHEGAEAHTAAGLSPAEAALEGVRELAEREVAARLAHHQCAPVGIPGGGERELLRATGCDVRAFDLSAVLCGVPSYAVTLDGAAVVLRCGQEPGATLAEALGLALLAWQAAHDGGAAYAPRPPRPLPQLPDAAPPSGPVPHSGAALSGNEATARPVGLLEGLTTAGLRPVAVPLPAGGPYVAKVILLNEDEGEGEGEGPAPVGAGRREEA
ncbi:YcaO-like family protein [Streptomyces sp. NBC_01186]|uniref:hypothetical protein n=1 Tax=unclassified Streptomyces TaxID=2593676 RepID=UPI002DDA231A|nr:MULTISPECIES: hypothetical protein [unclassified Streptomyces]WSB75458.1 YcaO-like family protein [Streptomyces sp. NBC_01775]WSS16258.1 YcaO-like family protein [Streptomyces sp. NBC_01186]